MKAIIQESKNLFDHLQTLFPESSKNSLRSLIQQERVWINDKPVRAIDTSLRVGDFLEIKPRKKFERANVKIVFEDQYLVVVEKPFGLLSVADDDGVESNLHDILKNRPPQRRVWPIHRLDRETSGLILFAYTEEVKEALKAQMEKREISRYYKAIVEGHLAEKSGTWRSYLRDDAALFVSSHPDGKLAITHYEVIRETKKNTLLHLALETGRKNQIRAHAREAGHSVVGDKKYGATQDFLGRMALHAETLSFVHPIRQKRLTFTCPAPF